MIIEFASKKRRRNCSKGYPCGNSCINKSRNCRKKLSGQASNYADWLKIQGQKSNDDSSSGKPKKRTTRKVKPLTDEQRSQPDSLIKVGRDFAAKYKLDDAIAKYKDYKQRKADFDEQERKRIQALVEEKSIPLSARLTQIEGDMFLAADNPDEFARLAGEQDKALKELESLKKEVSPKYFDRFSEIVDELVNAEFDGSLDAKKRQKLEAELESERNKIPGNREFPVPCKI